MRRMTLSELDAACQKFEHRRLGNWMARHVTRPMALRVTQVIAPWGFGANAATLCAWLCAAAAAVAFAQGGIWSFVAGSVLLQAWYLLDHVDGQLARLRRTESLDGVSLDYLMHHTVNLLLPLGIGHGLFVATCEPLWLWAGVLWGMSLLTLGIAHDARYKAFIQRLKRVQGNLVLVGGGGGRPEPAGAPPLNPIHLAGWLTAKCCEMHVIMNLLALSSLVQLLSGDRQLIWAQRLAISLTACAIVVAARRMHRLFSQHEAEREFASWIRPPAGHYMAYEEGWWCVRAESAEPASTAAPSSVASDAKCH